ncbi:MULTISPECIES: hypothetical protein [Spirulina sp. CCY15215]|uniref:hypothetical protein n=1 Tax=Spirulina sp. CCY15215 TaxID=2767591 RepID=UPI00194F0018|nr:hypothetical protein [Spirulina major]
MSGKISTAIVDFQENLEILNQEALQERFDQLKSQWKQDTEMLSSISRIIKHPAYQKIILIGERAIPLILSDLQKESDHWFYALTKLTKTDPVKPEDDFNQAVEVWLNWGKQQGYIQ